MSIEDELLNLARLCHTQARLTQDRAVKHSLRKLGTTTQARRKSCRGNYRHICNSLTSRKERRDWLFP